MTDKILDHPFIVNERDSFHWEDRYRLREAGGSYPAFAALDAPFTPSVALISWDVEAKVARVALSQSEPKEYPTIRDAYHAYFNGVDSFVYFESETLELSEELSFDSGRWTFVSDASPVNIYHEHADELRVTRYVNWLRVASRWLRDPKDFYQAHQFVKFHPATWLKREANSESSGSRSWNTSCGIPEVSIHSSQGRTIVALEGSVRGLRSDMHHAHDENISAYCGTYEESILSYALKLHEFYDVAGARRTA